MALPSPVAALPDMSPFIRTAQARANQLLQSSWVDLASLGPRPQMAAPATAPQGTGQPQPMAQQLGQLGQPGPSRPAGALAGSPDELTLLAKTIQAEAGAEGYDGMLAVGAVIGNRARSGKYGGSTLRDVIMAPGQFSAWNGVTGYAGGKGALDMDRIQPSDTAMQVANAILAGGYNDPTGGATHYYNPAVATPKWGQSAGGQWQTIGNHIFGFADGRPGAHPRNPSTGLT